MALISYVAKRITFPRLEEKEVLVRALKEEQELINWEFRLTCSELTKP